MNNKHSYIEDLNCFSTDEGKSDFLFKYVEKYKNEFIGESTENLNKHSLIDDIELFSTIQGKVDFLQNYVTKHENTFEMSPFLFNRLSFLLFDMIQAEYDASEIEIENKKAEENDNEDEDPYIPYIKLPPIADWTEIPVFNIPL